MVHIANGAGRGWVSLAFAFILALFALVIASSCALMPGYTSAEELAAENLAIADGYAGLEKYGKAIDYYRKASRSPKYRNAADWGLARSLSLSGDWEAALPILERLHGQDRENRLIAEAYAYALISSGKLDEGLDAYRSVYDRDRDNPEAAVNYVEALAISERWDSVLSEAAVVRSAFPENENLARLDALEEKARTALAPEPPETEESADGTESADAIKSEVPTNPGDQTVLPESPGESSVSDGSPADNQ